MTSWTIISRHIFLTFFDFLQNCFKHVFHNKLAKELSLWNKLWYSNPISTHCCRPLIFQTMNYVRLNDPSLKYQRFTSTSCRDVANVCGKNSIFLSSDLWSLSVLCKMISSWMSSSPKKFSKILNALFREAYEDTYKS